MTLSAEPELRSIQWDNTPDEKKILCYVLLNLEQIMHICTWPVFGSVVHSFPLQKVERH
jgi:hypothetical protein